MNDFIINEVVCKKDVSGRDAIIFKQGVSYKVKVFANGAAVVFDEMNCIRELYNKRSQKFYQEFFMPMDDLPERDLIGLLD